MNFQQLRTIRETVRQNFNLTEVASALFTSQSGVSKQIKDSKTSWVFPRCRFETT
jgi:LysR family cys regulon transcriptional activator